MVTSAYQQRKHVNWVKQTSVNIVNDFSIKLADDTYLNIYVLWKTSR